MIHHKSFRLTAFVLAAAVVIVAAGGAVIASNMGFKLNKPLYLKGGVGGGPQQGNNWTSIPYFNPYGNFRGFCQQTGLPAALVNPATLVVLDPVTGSFTQMTCFVANGAGGPGPNLPTNFGRGIEIRVPNTTPPTTIPIGIIIVGSHNPVQTVPIVPKNTPGFTGQKGNIWFGVPYHSTAATQADLCAQLGLNTVFGQQGSITRLNPANGSNTVKFCGTAGAGSALVLGEMVQVTNQRPDFATINPVPAHF